MRELSEKYQVKPELLAKTIPQPTNREHTSGDKPPINVFLDPAVAPFLDTITKEQRSYLIGLVTRVSRNHKTNSSLRTTMNNKDVPLLDPSDPDTPFDKIILERLFFTGLYRSMDR